MPIFKDQPCPTCGTVKYKRTAEAGYVCKYGHRMEGYREEQGDDDAGFGVRSTKRKRVQNTSHEHAKRIYGAELEDAFKRVFQYALQVMARSFVKDLGFPTEFEYVLRELWLLYIHDSKVTLVNAHIVDVPNATNKSTAVESFMEPEDLFSDMDSDSDFEDDSRYKHANVKTTPTTSDRKIRGRRKGPALYDKWPKLRYRHVIVLCYIACVYLGWPVSITDIRRWCASMRLPYLQIHKQLPQETLDVIDLRILPSMLEVPPIGKLRVDVRVFMNAYIARCGLSLPKYNVAPLIFRYCTQLFLPVEMYFCAQELYAKYPYNHFSVGNMEAGCNYHAIDIHIMMIVVVLAKFLYNLDDAKNTELQYDIPDLSPPLPKKIWMKHIQANADRWEDLYRTKMIDSPEVELGYILEYLKGAKSFSKDTSGARREQKSLARRYITKINDHLGQAIYPSPWRSDLLQNVPQISVSTIDQTSKDDHDNTVKIIGDHYPYYLTIYKAGGKILYKQEYQIVLLLASRILESSFEEFHGRLATYEMSLIRRSASEKK